MAKKAKERTLFLRMVEAREIAEDLIAEGWDDKRVTVLAEQFLELRELYKNMMDRCVFGIKD